MEQPLLEMRKEDKSNTIFWTSSFMFKQAIILLGGRVKSIYTKKGEEVAWELIAPSSKDNEIIKMCKSLKAKT